MFSVIYLKWYIRSWYCIWNFTSGVDVPWIRLVFGLAATSGFLYISDIVHSFDHDKSSSISQLINGKSRNFHKLLKYFNGTTTSVSYVLLSFGLFHINFVLYSKDLLVIILLSLIL